MAQNSKYSLIAVRSHNTTAVDKAQHKKASNHHANLSLEMYSFTL